MRFLKRYLSLVLIVTLVFSFAISATAAVNDPIPKTQVTPAGLNYDQYPSLKDVYKDYFMIGTVGALTGPRSGLIGYHFNAYTPENEMKPQSVQNVKGTFTFNTLNNLLRNVTALSGDMKLIGHTLAWHSQTPNWMWDAPNFDRATALGNLNAHIDRILGEYGERLYSIDVVNEAIGTANPTNWKASLDKGEGWTLALGWEWVELAFVRAAKVIDDNGWNTKLYYNDFGLDSAAKAQTVYAMVKDINERYAGTRPNGKPLIEGIGMQGHYNSSTKPENVETSIKLFATLPGVSVSVTELDIEWPNLGSLTTEQAVAQGQKYAQLFQIYRNYAAGPANKTANPKVVERVTFWGTNDADSWKREGYPLLFNAPNGTSITAKEALVAVLAPDTYLEMNPVVIKPEPEQNKPINGVYVYNTSKGDSWSGANLILGNNANVWPWSTAGADGKVAFTPEKDATYRIAVNYTSMGTNAIRVRWLKDESNSGYTAQDGQVVSTPPYNSSLNPSQVATRIPAYFNNGMSTGNSYTLITEIKLDSSQAAGGLIGNIAIRGGAGGNSFSINEIKVEKVGSDGKEDKLLVNWPVGIKEPEPEEPVIVIPPAGQTYEAYPPLKGVYKDYFTMGIFGAGENNALIHNFAAYTPGNEMKPESTQNVKGTFTYNSVNNAFYNLTSKNPNMLFYGHTLAWHSQSPTWMWDAPPARYGQPGTFDKATALANLNNHIENVLGNFGGRLKGIDVVNEAVGTANPNDWKASLAKGEGWYMALGWEWVELAFLKAASVVDSHPEWESKLIYNDFGLDSPSKARVVYEMVKSINERYAGVRPNGKPLIEVIGMQAHYNLTTSAANVENSIKLFATLPGVSINITEMDIGSPPVGVLTPVNENNQAVKFAELFQIYRKYAAGPANKTNNPKVIDRVSICGVRDATTGWRAGEFALLFTSNGLAKQALVAVLDPNAFLETHKYIEPETEPEQKPVDGVYVYDAGKGDAWTGANIILGNNANAWPWSTAGADGKVAFTPEKDAKYRLTFNYTAKGTTALRIRWIKDDSNGNYTDADGAVVNSYQYSASQVATTIPAYFNSGMVNMGSYTLTTEIKLDGSQPANGLLGNIAIRGGGGGNAYSINWIKVEKIGTGGAADKLMVSWPKEGDATKHKITATAGTGGTITPSGEVEVVSGASQTFTITANSNYSIANVLVDGVSVGAVSTYTINQVKEDHTIAVTFSYNGGAVLTGTDHVMAGESFNLVYGLGHMKGSVLAQDVTITFDADKLELASPPVSVDEGKFLVVGYKADPAGTLRILGVHLGEWQSNPNAGLITLSFKAKGNAQTGSTDIKVTRLVTADGTEAETVQSGAVHTVQIAAMDKTALNALIAEAQNAHDQAVEGKLIGQYPAGSKATLQAAINAAVEVANNPAASQTQIDSAASQLNAALLAFKVSVIVNIPGDHNNDGKVSVGDLAVMAKAYGITSADAEWDQVKHFDLNGDNQIDILDLVMLARMIFEW
ncbi:endo-1,4-beta-xylanase [Paenibacillus planticolens]|uniref:Beta-xylanase n=1 Tax=Paenibacillus planticolens TaxID=2654976 RepID=A0ABX1ZF80_9BACL|nr:endo-1,4-beta-xylanase [Paenibacillus planticolens]NOU98753.1 hypothetical protein [Paenibacillus planticolens]